MDHRPINRQNRRLFIFTKTAVAHDLKERDDKLILRVKHVGTWQHFYVGEINIVLLVRYNWSTVVTDHYKLIVKFCRKQLLILQNTNLSTAQECRQWDILLLISALSHQRLEISIFLSTIADHFDGFGRWQTVKKQAD